VFAYTSIVLIGVDLKRDFGDTNTTFLALVASALLRNVPTACADAVLPRWNGPNPTTILILAMHCVTVAASLFTISLAIFGKHELRRYPHVETHGSIVDRGRDRQRRTDKMVTWRFDPIMGYFPLMLLAALLLFICALSSSFFGNVLADIVRFTAFISFVILIASAATPHPQSPAPTLSLIYVARRGSILGD
jgi:hypothetical protein